MTSREIVTGTVPVSGTDTGRHGAPGSRGARNLLWLAAVVAIFCASAIGVVYTKRPWCDEGWFASVVYNLLHHGVMGLTVLDPHGFIFDTYVKGIDRYTYWIFPSYILGQAAWCSLAG